MKDIRKSLSYDPATGIFRWLIRPRQRECESDIAGSARPGDYRKICINQRTYRAHRLAWWFVYGTWPLSEIDHINGNRDDNRIENLREATKSKNQANSKLRTTNNSGYKGAGSPLRGRKKYPSRITINYKTIWLGSFDTAQEAHAAYLAAAKTAFGNFARAK